MSFFLSPYALLTSVYRPFWLVDRVFLTVVEASKLKQATASRMSPAAAPGSLVVLLGKVGEQSHSASSIFMFRLIDLESLFQENIRGKLVIYGLIAVFKPYLCRKITTVIMVSEMMIYNHVKSWS